MNKKEFLESLWKRNFFWQYDAAEKKMPDNIVIEQVLIRGDVVDLDSLFSLFSHSKIQRVWEEKVIPDERYYKANFYLATVYFDVKKPSAFLAQKSNENSRFQKLKLLASQD